MKAGGMAIDSLRIATFNLENLGQEEPGGPSLAARIRALRPMLERLEADVLCLQEVNAASAGKGRPRRLTALSALLEGTRYSGWPLVATAAPSGIGPMDVHNLVLVSRLPIAAQRQLRHELVAPPLHETRTALPPSAEATPLAWDRPLLHARLALPDGRSLHVVNLHLRSPLAVPLPGQKVGEFAWRSTSGWAEGFFMAAVKRAGQALEARLLVDTIFDGESEPLLAVAGDFNADAHEVPVRIVMAAEEDTGNGDLAERALVAVERSLPRSRRFSVLHHGAPQMLDHILVSRALMARYRGCEIHNEALGDELVGYHGVERPPESFHAPVVACFAVERPQAGALRP
jgi:endonuclease/exonuclease/phosphatase family metal-dependent hydrolase